MSTAARVPETWELTGDDARETLVRVGRRTLVRDAFLRLRYADGFSHARSLAFMTSLVLVQGLIAAVGLAALAGSDVSAAAVRAIKAAVPGPAHRVLTDAVRQASETGRASLVLPVVLGGIGALVSGTTLLGQLERALNRLYGVEQDRPTVQKYGRAFVLAITAGACVTAAFVLFAFGRPFGEGMGDEARSAWDVVRWPLAFAFVVTAMSLLFRRAPRRHQPAFSWLAFGAAVSTVLWSAATLLLGLLLTVSSTFGDTYGPLAGIVALQLWSVMSAVAVLLGAAIAAQLEAARAGEPLLQEPGKVDADTIPEPAAAVAG